MAPLLSAWRDDRGIAALPSLPHSALPMPTWRSSARSRSIGSSARRTSPPWSAARSIVPTTGCSGFSMPAMSIGRARNSTTTRPSGSGPMIYALADRGVRLLRQLDGGAFANTDWSRKNRLAQNGRLSSTRLRSSISRWPCSVRWHSAGMSVSFKWRI